MSEAGAPDSGGKGEWPSMRRERWTEVNHGGPLNTG